ncbi:MAG: hypothetical protein DRO09_00595 [Thermoprotei archaeon]|nr:MAG: hypothetical protein DRO09_00595 [Thermoprotei archaeon]
MSEVKVLGVKVKGYTYPRLPVPWDIKERLQIKPGDSLKCRVLGEIIVYYKDEEGLNKTLKTTPITKNENKTTMKTMSFDEFKQKVRELAEKGDEDALRLTKRWEKDISIIRHTFNLIQKVCV